MLIPRLLSALVAIPLVALIVWVDRPSWLFPAFVLGLTVAGQWELYRMFTAIGVEAEVGAGLLLGALTVLAFALEGPERSGLVPGALTVAVMASLTLGLRHGADPGARWPGIALTLTGVLYCALLLGHAIWLRGLPGGARLTLLLLWVTWSGESAAYFVGRRWGRRPLAPRLSPAKTVEGALAQLAVSVAAAVVVAAGAWVPLGHAAAMGIVLGVAGQVGDLVESFLKRSAAAKDAGGILPGHGGLLDRLDSLLFNVPALYYYASTFPSSHG
jgi:phosphatidate cytidylyltransferase